MELTSFCTGVVPSVSSCHLLPSATAAAARPLLQRHPASCISTVSPNCNSCARHTAAGPAPTPTATATATPTPTPTPTAAVRDYRWSWKRQYVVPLQYECCYGPFMEVDIHIHVSWR